MLGIVLGIKRLWISETQNYLLVSKTAFSLIIG